MIQGVLEAVYGSLEEFHLVRVCASPFEKPGIGHRRNQGICRSLGSNQPIRFGKESTGYPVKSIGCFKAGAKLPGRVSIYVCKKLDFKWK
jgi:hypothetical protein